MASDSRGKERECIFPFYWGDKLYDTCALYSPVNLAVPLFICPTRNTTKKYPGTDINHFPDIDLRETYYRDTDHFYSTCQDLEGETCNRDPNSEQRGQGCDLSTCQMRVDPTYTSGGTAICTGTDTCTVRAATATEPEACTCTTTSTCNTCT